MLPKRKGMGRPAIIASAPDTTDALLLTIPRSPKMRENGGRRMQIKAKTPWAWGTDNDGSPVWAVMAE